MAIVLHGSARTTPRVRAELQASKDKTSAPAESLKAHVLAFVAAYNLKGLRWRTPFETLCQVWTKEPSIFKLDRAASSRDQTSRASTSSSGS
jgi:hypothetical protein